jgi:endonuclease YncB( thermonuclease family)
VLGLDGSEDRAKSRRVVFGVTFDQGRVLDAIGDEVAAPIPDASGGSGVERDRAPSVTEPQREALSGSGDEAAIRTTLIEANADGRDEGSAADEPDLVGVASVIDADTIEIRGARIRLHGIDAPESSQICLDATGAAFRCGQAAALALADRVGRRPVACDARGQDRYGRIIAVCRTGTDPRSGTDLGAWLVEEGLAYAYRRYSEDYVVHEDTARAAGRGFWAGQFEPPWEQR